LHSVAVEVHSSDLIVTVMALAAVTAVVAKFIVF
jgi:hypothetical protein